MPLTFTCDIRALLPRLHRIIEMYEYQKKVKDKSRECHNHKPQPFPDTKRKRKQIKPNKHKLNKRMKSTKISFLFPKRGNRNAQRTEKHKTKIMPGKNKKQFRVNQVRSENSRCPEIFVLSFIHLIVCRTT